MRLHYGRHQGLLTEVLLLRHPDYVGWILAHGGDGVLTRELRQLAERFDARPLRALCEVCWRPAAHAYVYDGQTRLHPRCAACALYVEPPAINVAHEIATFSAALDHVARTVRRGRQAAKRQIIRELTRLKGGPMRISEASATLFLSKSATPWLPAAPLSLVSSFGKRRCDSSGQDSRFKDSDSGRNSSAPSEAYADRPDDSEALPDRLGAPS